MKTSWERTHGLFFHQTQVRRPTTGENLPGKHELGLLHIHKERTQCNQLIPRHQLFHHLCINKNEIFYQNKAEWGFRSGYSLLAAVNRGLTTRLHATWELAQSPITTIGANAQAIAQPLIPVTWLLPLMSPNSLPILPLGNDLWR